MRPPAPRLESFERIRPYLTRAVISCAIVQAIVVAVVVFTNGPNAAVPVSPGFRAIVSIIWIASAFGLLVPGGMLVTYWLLMNHTHLRDDLSREDKK
jgi:hypothetical protein